MWAGSMQVTSRITRKEWMNRGDQGERTRTETGVPKKNQFDRRNCDRPVARKRICHRGLRAQREFRYIGQHERGRWDDRPVSSSRAMLLTAAGRKRGSHNGFEMNADPRRLFGIAGRQKGVDF